MLQKYHHLLQGPECCSEFTVSFHYVTPEDMYLMEFLLYHARIFGRHSTAKGKEIFTTQEAVISDKAPNEVLLSPKYIWHYLFRYSRFEWIIFKLFAPKVMILLIVCVVQSLVKGRCSVKIRCISVSIGRRGKTLVKLVVCRHVYEFLICTKWN